MNKRTEKKFQSWLSRSDKGRRALPLPDGAENLPEGELKRWLESVMRQAFAAGVNLERER